MHEGIRPVVLHFDLGDWGFGYKNWGVVEMAIT